MRLSLKVAILASRKSQHQISNDTQIPETRLSELVHGWTQPRDDERKALAVALNRSEHELFGTPAEGDEALVGSAMRALQLAITSLQALGWHALLNRAGTLKLDIARHFSDCRDKQ